MLADIELVTIEGEAYWKEGSPRNRKPGILCQVYSSTIQCKQASVVDVGCIVIINARPAASQILCHTATTLDLVSLGMLQPMSPRLPF